MSVCVLQVDFELVERFAFYERAKKTYAVVRVPRIPFHCVWVRADGV